MRIVAFSSLLLLGCVSPPTKPVVEVGAIDYPATQIIAGLSDGSDRLHREPLESYDKATCFKPKDWEQEIVYIHLLEAYAARCQKAAQEAK